MEKFDSDYEVRLATLGALGGDTTKDYDSVYEIDLEILRLTEEGGGGTSYTAGQNITIDANNSISADGYIYESTGGTIVTCYRQDSEDGGQLAHNTASGLGSLAEGYNTTASGEYAAHAEGYNTTASGMAAHSEGGMSVASGLVSHAEGWKGVASGEYGSHAEGCNTEATGQAAHAEGWGGNTAAKHNIASGAGSHVEGCQTQAQNQGEHAEGNINLSHKNSTTVGDAGNTLHSIGCGIYANARKNAQEVMQNGDYYVLGVGGYQGTDTKVQNASIKTVQEVINSKANAVDASILMDTNTLTIDYSNINTFITPGEYTISLDIVMGQTTYSGFGVATMTVASAMGNIMQTLHLDLSGVNYLIVRQSSNGGSTWTNVITENDNIVSAYINDTTVVNDVPCTYSQNKINQLLSTKQNTLTAGSNITISGNTISATDTTYQAGEGISISGNTISAAGGGSVDMMIEVTYAQLKALRDNSQLVPGQQYRITDFVTTCSDEAVGADESPARSVGYPFDIIVTADDVNKLNENARAINHPGVLIHNDIHYHEDYYEIYYDGYNDFPYAGTIEIDGTTYYKWGQNDGSYGGMFYLLTTESSYTNTVSGTDDCGDYWLTTYPIAGALSSDGETSVEFYEGWTEKQKSIIETHEDNGTLYLRIADAFDACEGKLQEEYTSTDHFYKNDLNSWEIKYSLDNDGDRFSWALTEDKPGLGFAAIKVNTTKTENATKLVLGDEIDCVGDDYEGDGHYYIDADGLEYSYKGSITDNGITYHIWYEPYKQNTVLTTQATYSNSVSGTNGNGCSYYDTVYDIVGEITIDGEEFQDLYKSAKKIIKTDQEELEGSFLYKRYPAGDTANSYAWVYVKYSFDTNINDESVDWTNVDSNDLIYTTSLTPSVGTEISGTTIIEYNANVQEVVGRGVIYYMKDEWNNQMNYDFKNIQYDIYGEGIWLYTFDDGNFVDSSLLGESNNNNFVSTFSSDDSRMYLYQYINVSVNQNNLSKTYTAGSNIQISNEGVISATDTTYQAGEGISISGNTISCIVSSDAIEDVSVLPDANIDKNKICRLDSDNQVYIAKGTKLNTPTDRLPDDEQIGRAAISQDGGYMEYHGEYTITCADGVLHWYRWGDTEHFYITEDDAEHTINSTKAFYIDTDYSKYSNVTESSITTTDNKSVIESSSKTVATIDVGMSFPMPVTYKMSEETQIENAFIEGTYGDLFFYTGEEVQFEFEYNNEQLSGYKWVNVDRTTFEPNENVFKISLRKAEDLTYYNTGNDFVYYNTLIYTSNNGTITEDYGQYNMDTINRNAADAEQVGNAYIYIDSVGNFYYTGELATINEVSGYKWETSNHSDFIITVGVKAEDLYTNRFRLEKGEIPIYINSTSSEIDYSRLSSEYETVPYKRSTDNKWEKVLTESDVTEQVIEGSATLVYDNSMQLTGVSGVTFSNVQVSDLASIPQAKVKMSFDVTMQGQTVTFDAYGTMSSVVTRMDSTVGGVLSLFAFTFTNFATNKINTLYLGYLDEEGWTANQS